MQLLARWAASTDELKLESGRLVDWLGCRTDLTNYAALAVPESGGLLVTQLPVPDDSVHADAIEYVALLTAVERALQRSPSTFCALELGASYAPWTVHAGLAGRRAGFDRVVLRAVEASESAIGRIHAHAELNGLTDDPRVDLTVRHAAVAAAAGHVYFPLVDTSHDNGAQATTSRRRRDYRGRKVKHVKVPAVTLSGIVDDLDVVDFVHMDLQGGEGPLLTDRATTRCLTERVACLMLATHSRLIEGLALRALGDDGWQLLRERPTGFSQSPATAEVTGWTVHDGAQLWVNPRLA